jgi:hypothetical protein
MDVHWIFSQITLRLRPFSVPQFFCLAEFNERIAETRHARELQFRDWQHAQVTDAPHAMI